MDDLIEKIKRQADVDRASRRDEIIREWGENPKLKEDFLDKIRQQHREDAIEGLLDGWWDLDDDFEPIQKAQEFSLSEFADVKNPTLAHVIAKAGIFPSVGQARKNGWDIPLTTGEWTVTKKKFRIRIVE